MITLTVSTQGDVADCKIRASSGSQILDEAACNAVSKRAIFMPARDENGQNIVGKYTTNIRWQLP